MSKKIINPPLDIEDTVMAKVRANEIAMRPRWYFILGSLLTIVGLTASTVMAIFLANLSLFLLKDHGPMGEWRLQQIVESFPFWVPILALVGIVSGIWILKKFDFSYKRNFYLVILGFVLVVVLTSLVLDITGLNNTWFRQGPMRGLYRLHQNRDDDSFRRNQPTRGLQRFYR